MGGRPVRCVRRAGFRLYSMDSFMEITSDKAQHSAEREKEDTYCTNDVPEGKGCPVQLDQLDDVPDPADAAEYDYQQANQLWTGESALVFH